MFVTSIYYIRYGVSYQALEDVTHIKERRLRIIVPAVLRSIADLHNEFIKFPKTPESIRKMEAGFYAVSGLPRCIGAADGTLIRIARPSKSNEFCDFN